MYKLQYGSNDGLKCCPRGCPERSPECRRTCEKWKSHREKALQEYDRRAKAGRSYNDSPQKKAAIARNARKKLNGH